MSFKTLLKRLQRPYGSVKAFAEALDVAPTRLSRGLPFDIRGCLRLAQVTAENPSAILRAAGKGDIAQLIEAQYGTPSDRLTLEETELLQALHAITAPDQRRLVIQMARVIARLPAGASGASGAGTPGDQGGTPPAPTGTPPPEGWVNRPPAVLLPRRARA